MLRLKLFGLSALVTVAVSYAYMQLPGALEVPPYVTSGDRVYLLMPPLPIVGDRVESISWSPSGDYLLARQIGRDDAGALRDLVSGTQGARADQVSLVVYDLKRRETKEVWTGQVGRQQISQVEWLSGTDSFAMIVEEPLRTVDPTKPKPSQQSLFLVDAARPQPRLVMRLAQEGGVPAMVVEPCPLRDWALLMVATTDDEERPAAVAAGSVAIAPTRTWSAQYSFLYPNGEISRVGQVQASAIHTGWRASDGAPLLDEIVRGDNGRAKVNRYVLDPKTGRSELVQNVVEWTPAENQSPIAVTLKQKERGKSAELVSLSDDSRAQIAAEASSAVLSPRTSGVAYITDGMAIVRPLVEMPKQAFLRAVVEVKRMEAIRNAKMSGVAALMYGSDYDDVLPGGGFDMKDVLLPYVKNGDILKDFVYSFTGGNIADVKDPAHTELGYVPGPGGKAIIYVDGHVEWQPDKA